MRGSTYTLLAKLLINGLIVSRFYKIIVSETQTNSTLLRQLYADRMTDLFQETYVSKIKHQKLSEKVCLPNWGMLIHRDQGHFDT